MLPQCLWVCGRWVSVVFKCFFLIKHHRELLSLRLIPVCSSHAVANLTFILLFFHWSDGKTVYTLEINLNSKLYLDLLFGDSCLSVCVCVCVCVCVGGKSGCEQPLCCTISSGKSRFCTKSWTSSEFCFVFFTSELVLSMQCFSVCWSASLVCYLWLQHRWKVTKYKYFVSHCSSLIVFALHLFEVRFS